MKALSNIATEKNIYSFVLTLVVIIFTIGCNRKPNHTEDNLSEFFLGIPINCNQKEAERYVTKLYADSLIGSFKVISLGSEKKDTISIISRGCITSNTIHTLKTVGIDSVTSNFSIWANLILADGEKMIPHNVVTDLYFYKDKLLAIEIKPSAFSVIDMETLLNTYKEKYGEPLYIDKQSKTNYGKWDAQGIYYTSMSESPYITWEEDFYTDETLWSFKNAYIKLVNLHYTDVKVSVSEYSYNKAEEYWGKKYGAWDEQYLNRFLNDCTVLKRKYDKRSSIAVFYINRTILDEVNKDVKSREDNIQKIRTQKQREDTLRDSITNAENRKKYLKQRI